MEPSGRRDGPPTHREEFANSVRNRSRHGRGAVSGQSCKPALLERSHELEQAVAASFSSTADPRLRECLEALVRHLHAFVREVRPSEEEWAAAIDFLTAVGQA